MATLYDNAHAYATSHPTRDGGTWIGFCQSLMYRMCEWLGKAPNPVPSNANAAFHLAHISSTDATKAPIGAFHYWAIGADGHVGLDLKGGASWIFMASQHNTTKWGKNGLGCASISQYNKASGAKYLGWSLTNGKNGKVTK
jgi:hypothetical protein